MTTGSLYYEVFYLTRMMTINRIKELLNCMKLRNSSFQLLWEQSGHTIDLVFVCGTYRLFYCRLGSSVERKTIWFWRIVASLLALTSGSLVTSLTIASLRLASVSGFMASKSLAGTL